jgi:hypothetical protein
MKARCTVPTHQSYKNYGGRGITVCDEWFNDYLSFHIWALASGYNDHLTIDRKDNNGNYTADNCVWVTKRENGRHTRSTKITMCDAELIRKLHQLGVCIKELSARFGISRTHVSSILNNQRWVRTSENKKAA